MHNETHSRPLVTVYEVRGRRDGARLEAFKKREREEREHHMTEK
jgi:hypothetical protein